VEGRLVLAFPDQALEVEPGNLQALIAKINESREAFIAQGDDLNRPRFRYPQETYDPVLHDDPWDEHREGHRPQPAAKWEKHQPIVGRLGDEEDDTEELV
jgi:hypothetical protein